MPVQSDADTSQRFAWEEAKRPADAPRAAGALLEAQARAMEDLRERESRLRSEASTAEKTGDAPLLYKAHHQLGLQLETLGALEQAERALGKAVDASASESVLGGARAAAMNDQGVILARLGQHEEAVAAFAKACELAERASGHSVALAAQRNQGLMACVANDWTAALNLWDAAFRVARRNDDTAANTQILNNVAVLQLLNGNHDEALQLLNRAELLAQRAGDFRGLAFLNNNLGLIYSGPPRGNHFAAIPFTEMALDLVRSIDILARLYVLNNNIIVYEQAHLEPAHAFRTQLAETLKSFTTPYPSRTADIEQINFPSTLSNAPDEVSFDQDWTISAYPVLLRSCARCGPAKID